MSRTPVSTQDAGVVVSAAFPAAARVRAKAEFARVFAHGTRRANPLIALHWLGDDTPARLGLAVSRKVDPRAVGRNRIKRILRDAFRHLRPQLAPGAYVVVARSAARTCPPGALRAALDELLHRIGALPLPAQAGTMRAACPSAPETPSSSDRRSG